MDLIPTQRATVAEHIRLENEQKWTEVPRTLVQDARAFYDFVPVGQFKGIEGVQQLYQIIGAAFSNLRLDISAEYDLPGCSIREGVITATHTGDYMGVPASGNTVRGAFAAFFVFDVATGEMLGERLYLDHGAMLQQLQAKNVAAASL
jgi:SnoaL-like polyketide cyclase